MDDLCGITLLTIAKLYSSIILQQIQRQEEEDEARDAKDRKRAEKRETIAEKVAETPQRRATRVSVVVPAPQDTATSQPDSKNSVRGRGKPAKTSGGSGKISDYFKKADVEAKASAGGITEALEEAVKDDVQSSDVGVQNLRRARQPDLVRGGTMRPYQLEGLEWLTSLYENGLNGILADEMGLGKTIQTISLIAFLWERQSYGPFLIAAPLSTTSNWVSEFQKWTPDIPVVLYHGSKQEREEIRRKKLKNPGTDKFPVVVTTYEICMNDSKFLSKFGWKFIIIDEGHRIKNINCKLIRELQSYASANRLLITGTPLQNNLRELWSLLNFLMPQIFDKLEAFESWFDFSALKDKDDYDQIFTAGREQQLIASLHAILKPFLLRRVKADVESMMPKKREYVLYAPLSPMQRELYQAILDGTSRTYLEDKVVETLSSGTSTPRRVTSDSSLKREYRDDNRADTPQKSAKSSRESTPASIRGRTRGGARKDYQEVSDTKYFKQLKEANGTPPSPDTSELASDDEEERIQAATFALAKKQVAQKKLQNPLMQLRLCCDSPYNFFNPFDIHAQAANSDHIIVDETLVTTSGKMLLLDSLLPTLFASGHKVLIFSQFKTQLDLLELYATSLRGWNVCRIDGSIPQVERQAQIDAFNKPPTGRKAGQASNLFLLSTRAGGQGINLTAADTVILFDSDWNPQQDLQAQDRAHRIGQTQNVIVYRFATRGTVEQMILDQAEGKRRLEKLVIRKGGLTRTNNKDREARDEIQELQRLLRRTDGEKFDVEEIGRKGGLLGEEDLRILTDRSDEAYERAEKGLDKEGEMFTMVEKKGEGALLEGLKA